MRNITATGTGPESGDGVLLSNVTNSTFSGITATNRTHGIRGVATTTGNVLQGNTLSGNVTGISFPGDGNTFSDNDLSSNSGVGLSISGSNIVVGPGNAITNNGTGVLSSGSSNVNINNNIIAGNVTFGVQNTNNSVVINAENNFWGDPSGPLDNDVKVGGLNDLLGLSNPGGLGNAVTDFVDYFPFVVGITPQEQICAFIEEVQELVDDGVLNGGQGNSLITKLINAKNLIDDGNFTGAIGMLGAFINQVNAFINTGILSPEVGQALIATTNDIIDAINALASSSAGSKTALSVSGEQGITLAELAIIANLSATEDERFELQIETGDQDGNNLSFSLTQNPGWLSIDMTTGLITGMPLNEYVGANLVTVRVDDVNRGSDSTSFTIDVINVNDPPGNFSLLLPRNNAQIDTQYPTLVWQQAIDVDPQDSVRYEIILSTAPDLSDTVLFAYVSDTVYTIAVGLVGSQQYHWKVIAEDTSKVKAESGAIFMFSTSQVASNVSDLNSRLIPSEFGLSQNYPNPFNPSTTIQFALAKESHVKFEIYNQLGERIATLVDETRQAGYYSEQFNATGLASGIYFYRLQARPTDGGQAGDPSAGSGHGFVATKKLLLLR